VPRLAAGSVFIKNAYTVGRPPEGATPEMKAAHDKALDEARKQER
jgi:hypothetical protein